MNQLHTPEEIKYFDRLQEQATALRIMSVKYQNNELLSIAQEYEKLIKEQLEKYNSFIGMKCQAPPIFLSNSKDYRPGKIEGNFYFNAYSKSVRCDFRYNTGGFDTHSIIELIVL